MITRLYGTRTMDESLVKNFVLKFKEGTDKGHTTGKTTELF